MRRLIHCLLMGIGHMCWKLARRCRRRPPISLDYPTQSKILSTSNDKLSVASNWSNYLHKLQLRPHVNQLPVGYIEQGKLMGSTIRLDLYDADFWSLCLFIMQDASGQPTLFACICKEHTSLSQREMTNSLACFHQFKYRCLSLTSGDSLQVNSGELRPIIASVVGKTWRSNAKLASSVICAPLILANLLFSQLAELRATICINNNKPANLRGGASAILITIIIMMTSGFPSSLSGPNKEQLPCPLRQCDSVPD